MGASGLNSMCTCATLPRRAHVMYFEKLNTLKDGPNLILLLFEDPEHVVRFAGGLNCLDVVKGGDVHTSNKHGTPYSLCNDLHQIALDTTFVGRRAP